MKDDRRATLSALQHLREARTLVRKASALHDWTGKDRDAFAEISTKLGVRIIRLDMATRS